MKNRFQYACSTDKVKSLYGCKKMNDRFQPAKLALLILTFFSLLFTSGCFDAIEVDDMVYVVAMGLDSGIDGNVRMSMLLAVPLAVGVGPEPGEVEKSSTIITVEAPTIYGGMNIANSMMSKQLNFSHTKLVVISKELAEKGIEKYLNTYTRFREFRPETFFGISICPAEEFLKDSKHILEANPAKYYELMMESWKTTGFCIGIGLEDFYSYMRSTDGEAVAALLDVSKPEDSNKAEEVLSRRNQEDRRIMEGEYTAEDMPVVFDSKSLNMGAAVFKSDKMVGELNGRETFYYLTVTGQLNDSYFSIPDPEDSQNGADRSGEGNFVSLKLNLARKPVFEAEMKNDKPVITAHVFLEGLLLTAEGETNYSSGEGLKLLEDFSAEYIRKGILSFLEKTREELNSDICGIGKTFKRKFLIWDDWVRFRWADKYENAQFNVVTKVSIRRTGMTIKQIPLSSLKKMEKQ